MIRFTLFLLLLFPAAASAQLDISDAWIKNLPASVPVRAGYMSIYNPQARAFGIVGARSERFTGVDIHRTSMRDGLMRMELVPNLVIEAGSSLQLAPGELHFMMIRPVEPTRPGENIRVTIEFDDGTEQHFDMTVRK